LVDFLERESGKIPVELLDPSWLIFSEGFRIPPLRTVAKRIFDFTVSLIALLLVWPIMLLVAIAIKIGDGIRAPVFYRQIRVGHRGAGFSILKFRSMVVDAEGDSGAVWAQKDDSRITRIGHFLRNSRIDELPQLFNVILGQMSIVGPRPERPEFVQELEKNIPYYSERHALKPGVTGWAQLKYSYGASEEDAVEKLKFDLYYIKKHNVLLDLLIILQTVEVVLWSKGAR
jgi:sugar transferase (PEP-CTERM system associated)